MHDLQRVPTARLLELQRHAAELFEAMLTDGWLPILTRVPCTLCTPDEDRHVLRFKRPGGGNSIRAGTLDGRLCERIQEGGDVTPVDAEVRYARRHMMHLAAGKLGRQLLPR